MTGGAIRVPLPPTVTTTVALEPVYNILMTMSALRNPEEYGGIDEWVLQTAEQLPPQLRERHHFWMKWLWLDALINAVERGPATTTFPAYLEALASQDATRLRDHLLYWMVNSVHLRVYAEAPLSPAVDPALLLADVEQLTAFLSERFMEKVTPAEFSDLSNFHLLLNQPQKLQQELVDHLRTMWEQVVAPEWVRVAPRLQSCADAFQQIPFQGLTILEAIQSVTGRDLRPIFRLEALWRYRHVRFIPTIHNGPYVVWFGNAQELCIGFPAHQPPTNSATGLQFDQQTLVNRYKALADETRLGILWLLDEVGELGTQEVIDHFVLDKSAASRHLRQLVATSLIDERREEGAKKIYVLNRQTIDELMQSLHRLKPL